MGTGKKGFRFPTALEYEIMRLNEEKRRNNDPLKYNWDRVHPNGFLINDSKDIIYGRIRRSEQRGGYMPKTYL